MRINKSATIEIQIATTKSESISDSQVSIQYIKLPEIHRLIPDTIPQTALGGDGQRVVLEGRNFTEYSECVVFEQTMPTTLITDALLECHISDPSQLFAPYAYSDNRLSVRVRERGLYLNQEDNFTLLLTNQPYVYRVEPRKVFAATPGTLVEVHVSNNLYSPSHSDYEQQQQFLFC